MVATCCNYFSRYFSALRMRLTGLVVRSAYVHKFLVSCGRIGSPVYGLGQQAKLELNDRTFCSWQRNVLFVLFG